MTLPKPAPKPLYGQKSKKKLISSNTNFRSYHLVQFSFAMPASTFLDTVEKLTKELQKKKAGLKPINEMKTYEKILSAVVKKRFTLFENFLSFTLILDWLLSTCFYFPTKKKKGMRIPDETIFSSTPWKSRKIPHFRKKKTSQGYKDQPFSHKKTFFTRNNLITRMNKLIRSKAHF